MKALKWIAGIAGGVFVVSLILGILLGVRGAGGSLRRAVEKLAEKGFPGETRTGELTAPIEDIGRIAFDVDDVELTIFKEDRADVHVSYTAEGWAYEGLVKLEQDGGVLRLTSHLPDKRRWWTHWFEKDPCRVKVAIPQSFEGDLQLDADVGDVAFTGAQTYAAVVIDAGVATIRMEEITAASVAMEVDAGTVAAERLSADTLEADVNAGTLTLKRMTGGAAIQVDAGTVNLEYERLGGNIQANVSIGSVDIRLPADAAATLSLHADMGSVSQRCAAAFSGTDEATKVEGALHGGGPTITGQVDTGSMNVHY